MEYYSIGYITNPTLPDVTQDDVLKLTHINLAFGLVKDGLLDTHQLTNIGCIEQFRRWNDPHHALGRRLGRGRLLHHGDDRRGPPRLRRLLPRLC